MSLFELTQTLPQNAYESTKYDLILSTAHDAAASGIGMYADSSDKQRPKIGPITAFPAPFPSKSLGVARHLSSMMSVLMDKVSQDKTWIHESLADGGVLDTDDFNRQLDDIMMNCVDPCPIKCSLFRHDFMLHSGETGKLHAKGFVPFKNVELNTVSVGLAYLSDKTNQVHERNMNRMVQLGDWPHFDITKVRAKGLATDCFHGAFNEALKHGRETKVTQVTQYPAVAMMVVESVETSGMDQFGFWGDLLDGSCSDSPTKIVRPLNFLLTAFLEGNLRVDENKILLLEEMNMKGEKRIMEVSLIYWRVFYHPRHTVGPNEADFMKMRRHIEESMAIKVPSVAMQLAGTKEVQKRLSDRSTLERYLPSSHFNNDAASQSDFLNLLMDCTAIQVDPLRDLELMDKVIESDYENWVLKPQREGGGNNLFGADMVAKLKELKQQKNQESSGFVLMELIKPPKHNAIVCDLAPTAALRAFSADSELGIFSSLVVDTRLTHNKPVTMNCPVAQQHFELCHPGLLSSITTGTLLRTKPNNVREGGIHAGFGFLDSPILCDDKLWEGQH